MQFVNLKTCQGLESHLFLDGALVRLSELPELLRSRRLTEEVWNEVLGSLLGKLAHTASRSSTE